MPESLLQGFLRDCLVFKIRNLRGYEFTTPGVTPEVVKITSSFAFGNRSSYTESMDTYVILESCQRRDDRIPRIFFVFGFLFFCITIPVSASSSRLTLPVASNATLVIETKNGIESQTALISDSIASTKVILSSDGTTNVTPQYYPYGSNARSQVRQQAEVGSRQGNDSNNRYYTGQRKVDQDDALYNYNARYYSPESGIFTQPDTVQGINRFAYVGGNPIMNNDPSGHCANASLRGCLDPGEGLLGSSAWKQANYMSPEDQETAYQGILQFAVGGGDMLRFYPPAGAFLGGLEAVTGKYMGSGRELSNFERGFSGASALFFGGAVIDDPIGAAHRLIQQSRVSQYPKGAELLASNSVGEATNILKDAIPRLKFKSIPDPEDGTQALYEYYVGFHNISYVDGVVDLEKVTHEGVHALQYHNKFKGLLGGAKKWAKYNEKPFIWDTGQYSLSLALDRELMAYGATSPSLRFSQHLAGALFSTADDDSKILPFLSEGLNDLNSTMKAGGMASVAGYKIVPQY